MFRLAGELVGYAKCFAVRKIIDCVCIHGDDETPFSVLALLFNGVFNMGCRLCKGDVKEALDTDVKVDGKIGNGKEEGFTALPEPSTLSMEKLGMTAKQIFNLRQSWKGIKRNMEETGVEIFVR